MSVSPSEIGSLPLFASLDEDELARLAASAERVVVDDAGVELTRQGDFGHSLFVLLDGAAEVRVEGAIVRTLGRGDVFGELAVTASGRRTADVVSTTPVTLASIFKREVWAVEQHSPDFAAQLRALRLQYDAG